MQSPLIKGDSGGCVFPGLLLRQAQYRFTTPQPPFRSTERSRRSLRGILYALHRITRLNKMKIPIQLNYSDALVYCVIPNGEKNRFSRLV